VALTGKFLQLLNNIFYLRAKSVVSGDRKSAFFKMNQEFSLGAAVYGGWF
jgi:hypothetical protein